MNSEIVRQQLVCFRWRFGLGRTEAESSCVQAVGKRALHTGHILHCPFTKMLSKNSFPFKVEELLNFEVNSISSAEKS